MEAFGIPPAPGEGAFPGNPAVSHAAGELGCGFARAESQPRQTIPVSPSRALSAGCSLAGCPRPSVVPTSAGGLWPRGMGTGMGSAALASPAALRAGGHPLGTASIPFRRVGEEISPNILPAVPIR